MIKVRNIHKYFKDNHVLKGIDFDIDKGQVISIIGPSGSGKSTLLRCLNYLEKPDQGSIEFEDCKYDFLNLDSKSILDLRKRSAMVFQNYNLFYHRTILENITEPLIKVKSYNRREAEIIAKTELEKVGLIDKINQYPSKLSGGQQQRAGIARAISMNPELLLLDEPTSSLDPELIKEILLIIKKLADKDQTMIIVTHELSFARIVSDKILFLDEGKISAFSSPDSIFSNTENERLKNFIDAVLLKF